MTSPHSSTLFQVSVRRAIGLGILIIFPVIHLISPGREIGYSEAWIVAAYGLLGLALLGAYMRSSGHGPALWVTVIAAAPLFAPLVSMGLMGFGKFSLVGSAFQNEKTIILPFAIAALACISIALLIVGSSGQPLLRRYTGTSSRTLASRGGGVLTWLVIGLVLAVAAVLAADPTFDPIWISTYREQKEERIDALAFAGGAFIAGMVIALAAKIAYERGAASRKKKRVVSNLFWAVLVLCVFWKLAHGSRVEVAGIGLLFWLLYGKAPSMKSVKWFVLIGSIVTLSFVGYVRNHQWEVLSDREYVPLPGGVENVMSGWVAAYWLSYDGKLELIPGQTYAAQIQRLPPRMLNLDRWRRPYDLISEKVHLVGGEYFPIEPVINFGATGLALYVLIFVIVTNRCWAAIVRFIREPLLRRSGGFVLGGVWYSFLFRTLWYGLDNVIKGEIIALLLVLAMQTSMFRSYSPMYSKVGNGLVYRE